MSRIGLKQITLPAGVTVELANGVATVKGPKGSLQVKVPSVISVSNEGGVLKCTRANDEKHTKQLHGTTRANLQDAVTGVTTGFKKELVIVGIGYRCQMRGENIVMNVGYSHEIVIKPEPTVKISCPSATEIVVEGLDKQAVGQTAALIRGTREPEPYNGKGVMYKNEHIIRKEGKRAGAK
jgi:large subunit ribosomal protein L6